MNKNIRITENQLKRIINNVISEQASGTQNNLVTDEDLMGNTSFWRNTNAWLFGDLGAREVGVKGAVDLLDDSVSMEDLQGVHAIVKSLNGKCYKDELDNDKIKPAMVRFMELYSEDENGDNLIEDIESVGTFTLPTGAVRLKALIIRDIKAQVASKACEAPVAKAATSATAGGADANTFLDGAGLACVKSIKGAKLTYYAPTSGWSAILQKGYKEFVLVTFPDGKPLKNLVVTKDKQGYAYGSSDSRGAAYQNKWVSIGCDGSSIKIDLPKPINESISKEVKQFEKFAFYNKEKFLIKPKIKTYLNEQLSLDGDSGGDVSGSKTTGQPAPAKQTATGTAPTADPAKKSQVYPAYSLDDVRNRKGMLYFGLKDNKGVGELQHFLNIPITNVFDAATKSAVQDFQRKNNLTADGIVGKKTITAIETSKGQKSSEEMQRKADEFLAGKDAALGKLTGGINLPSSSTGLRRVSSNSQVTDTPTGGPTNATPVGPDIDQQRADAGGYLSDADKKAQAEKRAAEIQQELDSPGSKLFRANWNTKLNFRDPATRRVIVWKGEQLSPTDLEYLNQHMAKGGYKLKKFKDKGDGDGKYVWVKS